LKLISIILISDIIGGKLLGEGENVRREDQSGKLRLALKGGEEATL